MARPDRSALLVHLYLDEKDILVKYSKQTRRSQSLIVRELIRDLKHKLVEE